MLPRRERFPKVYDRHKFYSWKEYDAIIESLENENRWLRSRYMYVARALASKNVKRIKKLIRYFRKNLYEPRIDDDAN